MAEARLSPAARRDLDDIFEFTAARWDLQQALRYVQAIGDACQSVAEQPELGAPL